MRPATCLSRAFRARRLKPLSLRVPLETERIREIAFGNYQEAFMKMRSSPSIIALSSCMLLWQHGEASFAVRTSSSGSSTTQQTSYRFLEDQQRNFYGDYHMVYDKCFRVKVPNNNDDDGNAYFYNGAYRSQSMAYASFFLCPESAGCYDCDTSTAYVMDLQEYLESYVEHLQGYCNACQQKCRRRLDEQGDDGAAGGYNGMIDCYECADQCQFVNGNDDGNGGNDESQFLECQQAYEDEDGIQYYSAPTCGSSGNIEMGLFYDSEYRLSMSMGDLT